MSAQGGKHVQQMDIFEDQQIVEGYLNLSAPNGPLRKLLQYQPQYHKIGDVTHLDVGLTCIGVRFERADKTDPESPLARVHVMKLTSVVPRA